MVLSQLQQSSREKAGWGRGTGGDEGFHERFVILPVVNELFTLTLIRMVLSQIQQSSRERLVRVGVRVGVGGFLNDL